MKDTEGLLDVDICLLPGIDMIFKSGPCWTANRKNQFLCTLEYTEKAKFQLKGESICLDMLIQILLRKIIKS